MTSGPGDDPAFPQRRPPMIQASMFPQCGVMGRPHMRHGGAANKMSSNLSGDNEEGKRSAARTCKAESQIDAKAWLVQWIGEASNGGILRKVGLDEFATRPWSRLFDTVRELDSRSPLYQYAIPYTALTICYIIPMQGTR